MAITPFSVSPNPANLFITPTLRAAIHKVRYTIDNRQGLTCVLGDVGMGKSSLMRLLHLEYDGREEDAAIALLTDPDFHTPNAFVRSICQAFDVPMKRSFQAQKTAFKDFIEAQAGEGRNVILLLDEAQGMTSDTMEVLRGFLNYESNTAKLLQVVMAGLLDLRSSLKQPRNKALRSRIVMYSLLSPLTLGETKAMLEHRCKLAEMPLPFSDNVIELIYAEMSGVPRDILRTCGYAFETTKLAGETLVPREIAEAAIYHERSIMEQEDGEQE